MNKSYHQMVQTINRLLKLQPGLLSAETNLKDDLGLTDWEMTVLINQLERAYQVDLPDQELNQLRTVIQLSQRISQ
jgi:acyl carrier protein